MTSALLAGGSTGPIDFHTHLVPEAFPIDPEGTGPGWPCLACRPDGRRILEFGGKPFRRLDARSWEAARRIEDMERQGVSGQIVSPMPELFSYSFSPARSALLCDHVNHFTASLVGMDPSRFGGLGIVTMQDVPTAVRQIGEIRSRFGLIGIEIGSNINGVYAGDPLFDPIYQAAAEAGLIVFVHAFHPLSAGSGGLPAGLTPFLGFPIDVAHAAASCIARDLPTRFPGLKLLFSHGGGALGAILGRMDRGYRVRAGGMEALTRAPSTVARDLFYDSNVYDPVYLRHLAADWGRGRTVLGTDYPYDIMQDDPMPYLIEAGLSSDSLAEATQALLA